MKPSNNMENKTPLAIWQNSQEPSFWEVMDSFVLLAYASLAAQEPFRNNY